jgi:hypothetical protein
MTKEIKTFRSRHGDWHRSSSRRLTMPISESKYVKRRVPNSRNSSWNSDARPRTQTQIRGTQEARRGIRPSSSRNHPC